MREAIVLILLFLFGLCAAFEAGYIVRDFQKDDTREIAVTARDKEVALSGRLAVLEGPSYARGRASEGKPEHRK